ncbi:MAG: hypothetical protein HQK59_08070 [Deltaproteobacteria bacterium]|nr:hypothetical protein [Deltaproteobacteria bacterium]
MTKKLELVKMKNKLTQFKLVEFMNLPGEVNLGRSPAATRSYGGNVGVRP